MYIITQAVIDIASINTSSVRDELDRLKGEYVRLSADNAISGETKVLMSSLFTLLVCQMVALCRV